MIVRESPSVTDRRQVPTRSSLRTRAAPARHPRRASSRGLSEASAALRRLERDGIPVRWISISLGYAVRMGRAGALLAARPGQS